VIIKVTVVKIANLNTSVCGDVAAYIRGSLVCTLQCSKLELRVGR
jgi:hypothetical protein